MTQYDWAEELATQVGAEIKRRRTAQKISAQRLADACTEEGLPMSREVIANLENGRRSVVSLAEILVIARVLAINPIDLIVPGDAGPDEPYAVAPDETTTAGRARAWIAGTGLLQSAPVTFAELAELTRWMPAQRREVHGQIWGQSQAEQAKQAAAEREDKITPEWISKGDKGND